MINQVSREKPVIALTLGDASGIGSELVAKLLVEPDIKNQAHTVIVGDFWQWQEGRKLANTNTDLAKISSFADATQHDISFLAVDTMQPEDKKFSEVSAKCGESVLKILAYCMDASKDGLVDAICFAPLNKHAMKMGGLKHEDELHFFAEYLNVDSYICEFNTLGSLWTSRISSHIPLKEAYKYLQVDRIRDASRLIYEAIQQAGNANPRVAIAALTHMVARAVLVAWKKSKSSSLRSKPYKPTAIRSSVLIRQTPFS